VTLRATLEAAGLLRPRLEAAGVVPVAGPGSVRPSGWGVGRSRLAPFDFAPPTDVWSREAAMSVPSISRARDLICTSVGALPIVTYLIDFTDPANPVEQRTPPAGWVARPDPNRTRQDILTWTTDDLFFLGRGYWHVVDRYATTYPSAFERMPAADVNITSDGRVSWCGRDVPAVDVVEFLSPIDGILYTGQRAIATALNLDTAAERFSSAEIPAGWLEQAENSEPLSTDELADIASSFQAARLQRTVAALNPFIRWRESAMDPSRLQLVEARQYQAVELARVANIPAYFLNAPAGSGMAYFNTAQAKADLVDFALMPFIGCLEQTLGGPNVTPRGQFVRLDVNAWLRNPYTPTGPLSPTDIQIAYDPQSVGPAPAGPGRPRQSDGQTATGGAQ
jgi:hypothetical protein